MRHNARSRGFTLLEVLVAFLVLSLSMSVLMRIVSQSLNAMGTADRHQVALQLAESKLAEVLVHLDGNSRGKNQGRLDRDYRWESEVEPYEFDNQKPGERYSVTPLLIRVSVSWGSRPAERVSLSTIRLLREAP
ncbi:type IV pilus modification PilV family protein [Pseudomonas sp. SP16.1]|uniref:type IV pilus modification PilV family protein n=1 Tax=Pseudomonas sp. SP16.1 TaxID=3458854 RepID=UPI004046833C